MADTARQFKVDAYVMDTLLPDLVLHDHRPSTFIVYLYLWYRASGQRTAPCASHQEMAMATGLSKSAVQGAIRILIRRRLIHATREGITAVPQYTVLRPWRKGRSPGSI